jgi:hypothetical protein
VAHRGCGARAALIIFRAKRRRTRRLAEGGALPLESRTHGEMSVLGLSTFRPFSGGGCDDDDDDDDD